MARTGEHGYGNEHQKLRAKIQLEMDTGKIFHCWRCTQPIRGRAWDLGHDDYDRTKYNGPEHVACNRATRGHREIANTVDTSRMW